MNSDWQAGRCLAGTALAVTFTLLAACGGGGGSGVGYQDDAAPEARAQAIGGSLTTTGTVPVRSGGELLLTGQDSEGYDDPVLDFQWRQVDDSGVEAVLVERSLNSRALAVPRVDSAVTLGFELIITDSDGKQSTDRVNVRVLPVNDADLFLRLKVDQSELYQYALVITPEPGETGGGEFRLVMDTLLRWPDRDGNIRERLLDSETLTASWPQDANGTNPANAIHNPVVLRTLPEFEADDVNRFYETEGDRQQRLELDEIDDAELFLRIGLSSFDRNARIYARQPDGSLRQLFATIDGVVDSGLVPIANLHSTAGLESADSASKYYALIDAPETLEQWRQRAGFGPSPATQEGVAHANYLNNYDLGFGREMYLRVDRECGDVYSYVNNYPTLENALQRRNRFATVAMEYSAIDGSCHGEKVVKFLTYAPDESTGGDVLARSMNFDGRGEKFVPGVCIACHRGSIPDLSAYTVDEIKALDDASRLELAHMESTFIPWDMDALLFADDDPAFTSDYDRVAESVRDANTRSSLAAAIRELNMGALYTYRKRPERFAAPIQLVHGWYSGGDDPACLPGGGQALPARVDQLPDEPFDGSFVPCGWRTEPALYLDVFAKYCRSCHTQTDSLDKNFDHASELLDNPALVPYVFDQGSMPLARLTYDRFWSDFEGEESAARRLAGRLGLNPARRPGRPIARFAMRFRDGESGSLSAQPVPGAVVELDASGSYYAEQVSWGASSDCEAPPAIQGQSRQLAAFAAGAAGCGYEVTLEVSNARGSHRTTRQFVVGTAPQP